MARGHLYAAINPAMPGLVKIGGTEREPAARLRELSQATGVPQEFILLHSVVVSDWESAERLVHTQLASARVRRQREFFELSPADAIDALRAVGKDCALAEAPDPNRIQSDVGQNVPRVLGSLGPVDDSIPEWRRIQWSSNDARILVVGQTAARVLQVESGEEEASVPAAWVGFCNAGERCLTRFDPENWCAEVFDFYTDKVEKRVRVPPGISVRTAHLAVDARDTLCVFDSKRGFLYEESGGSFLRLHDERIDDHAGLGKRRALNWSLACSSGGAWAVTWEVEDRTHEQYMGPFVFQYTAVVPNHSRRGQPIRYLDGRVTGSVDTRMALEREGCIAIADVDPRLEEAEWGDEVSGKGVDVIGRWYSSPCGLAMLGGHYWNRELRCDRPVVWTCQLAAGRSRSRKVNLSEVGTRVNLSGVPGRSVSAVCPSRGGDRAILVCDGDLHEIVRGVDW